MNNNLSSCTIITFEPQEEINEDLMFFLDEYFEVNALNYTDDGKEQYIGYADLNFNKEAFMTASHNANIKLPPFEVEVLKNKNWLLELSL